MRGKLLWPFSEISCKTKSTISSRCIVRVSKGSLDFRTTGLRRLTFWIISKIVLLGYPANPLPVIIGSVQKSVGCGSDLNPRAPFGTWTELVGKYRCAFLENTLSGFSFTAKKKNQGFITVKILLFIMVSFHPLPGRSLL